MKSRLRNKLGFGLVEVIVAIGLMTIIIGIIADLMSSFARTTKSVTSFSDFNMLSSNITQALGRSKGCLDSLQGGNAAAPTFAGAAGTVFNQQVIYQPSGPLPRPQNWNVIADGRAAPPAPYVQGGNVYGTSIFIEDIILTKTLDLGSGHWVADLEIKARKFNATGPILESKKLKVNMQLNALNTLTSCQAMEPAVDSVQSFACDAIGGNFQKLDRSIAAQETIFQDNGKRVCTLKPFLVDSTSKKIPSLVFSAPTGLYDETNAPSPLDLVYHNDTGIWSPQAKEIAIMANGQDVIRLLGDNVPPGGAGDIEGRVMMAKAPNADLAHSGPPPGVEIKGIMRGRGANDLQVFRDAANQVASGAGSAIAGGGYNIGSGNGSFIGGGTKNTASGSRSTIAGGTYNEASCGVDFCASTVAGGAQNKAQNNYAAIIGGLQNEATGVNATVGGGELNRSTAAHSAILGGKSNDATGTFSAVLGGYDNDATGNATSVLGHNNIASGDSATVIGGNGNTASASSSTAGGTGTVASHQNSFAYGSGLTTGAMNQAVFGSTNVADPAGILIIGKGGGNNAFVVQTNGNAILDNKLTITNTLGGGTPALTVAGPISATGLTGTIQGSALALGGVALGAAGSVTGLSTVNAVADPFRVAAGNVTAVSFTVASDERLKKNILAIDDVISKITQINGVTYNWKDPKASGGRRQIGLLAQEVEKQFPEAVMTDERGFKSVNYQALVAPLIEAVKTQQNEIAQLKQILCLDHPNAKICKEDK